MTDSPEPDSTQRLFATLKAPADKPVDDAPARELTAGGLRGVIQEGVFRGVMKAVAVYALISLLVWMVIALVAESNRYN